MKNLNQYIKESLETKEISEIKKLGFKKYVEEGETWFEMKHKNTLIRVVQEEVGDNDWWNVKLQSDFLLNADNRPMAFESPLQAAYAAFEEINK